MNTNSPRLLICDLDGTLLNNLHRADKMPQSDAYRTEDWLDFNHACLNDPPVAYRVAMLNLLAPFYQLIYLTARGNSAMELTRASLAAIGAPPAQLIMRDEEDHRSAHEFKGAEIGRLLQALHKQPADLVLLDDDHLVCLHIARLFEGCTVIQVPSHDASHLRRHGLPSPHPGWGTPRPTIKQTAIQLMRDNTMSAQLQARDWLMNCHILDTETTGLDSSAEIVEICIIDQQGAVVLNSLVKPQRPIPADATRIHGITNDMVDNAPSWADIHDDICRIVASKPLVIYNADYDLRLMAQTANQYGFQSVPTDVVHCAMLAYAEFYGDWNDHRGSYRWQKLTNAAEQQGVVIEGQAHRALADVQMTLGVIMAMAASAGVSV